MKLIKDEKIIEATEKAYRVIYKEQGYTPYEDKVDKKADLTKAEIMAELDAQKIDYSPNDLKKDLLELLGSDK